MLLFSSIFEISHYDETSNMRCNTVHSMLRGLSQVLSKSIHVYINANTERENPRRRNRDGWIHTCSVVVVLLIWVVHLSLDMQTPWSRLGVQLIVILSESSYSWQPTSIFRRNTKSTFEKHFSFFSIQLIKLEWGAPNHICIQNSSDKPLISASKLVSVSRTTPEIRMNISHSL